MSSWWSWQRAWQWVTGSHGSGEVWELPSFIHELGTGRECYLAMVWTFEISKRFSSYVPPPTKPQHPNASKRVLGTKHSSIWAYGNHSHLNHHTSSTLNIWSLVDGAIWRRGGGVETFRKWSHAGGCMSLSRSRKSLWPYLTTFYLYQIPVCK